MAESDVLHYKLMILYMLKRVTFPMSNADLWTFFSSKETMPEASFQDIMRSLNEANLIHEEDLNGVTRYELTKEGDEALFYFTNDIPKDVVDSLEDYVTANRFRLRNQTGVSTNFDITESGEYNVTLKIREGKSVLFEMSILVPTEDQARTLATHLESKAQQVYADVMRKVV